MNREDDTLERLEAWRLRIRAAARRPRTWIVIYIICLSLASLIWR